MRELFSHFYSVFLFFLITYLCTSSFIYKDENSVKLQLCIFYTNNYIISFFISTIFSKGQYFSRFRYVAKMYHIKGIPLGRWNVKRDRPLNVIFYVQSVSWMHHVPINNCKIKKKMKTVKSWTNLIMIQITIE